MTVFRGYLLMVRRNLRTILMYIGIFVGISIMIQQAFLDSGIQEGFSSVEMNVAVIDRDTGVLAETLRHIIEKNHKLVELEDDPQILQEELYYGNVNYIIIVPKGAQEKLMKGEKVLQTISVPGAVEAYYAEAQVNSILNQIKVYLKGGFSMEDACRGAIKIGETKGEVTLRDTNGNGGVVKDYNYFFSYMPYAFFGASIMTIGTLIMEFKKKEIRQRIQSSAVPFWKQNLCMAGAFLLVGGMVWGICMAVQLVLYKGGVINDSNLGFYLLNSLDCILAAVSLGFFSGTISQSVVALNALNNILSLSLCFLGGIFVPLSMLGEGVQKVVHFLPTYWYSVVNEMLGKYNVLTDEMIIKIEKGLLIQLLFAVACFGISLMIRRSQMQES